MDFSSSTSSLHSSSPSITSSDHDPPSPPALFVANSGLSSLASKIKLKKKKKRQRNKLKDRMKAVLGGGPIGHGESDTSEPDEEEDEDEAFFEPRKNNHSYSDDDLEEERLGLDSTEETEPPSVVKVKAKNKTKKKKSGYKKSSSEQKKCLRKNLRVVEDTETTLTEALYEEDIVEGFSFVSFKNYEDLERMAKWSEMHSGKFPDPYANLKFEDPKKEKKKKKKKQQQPLLETQQKAKPNGNKAESGSSSEKGYICGSGGGDDDIKNKVADPGLGDLFHASKNVGVGLPTSEASTAPPVSNAIAVPNPPPVKGLYRPFAVSPPPPPSTAQQHQQLPPQPQSQQQPPAGYKLPQPPPFPPPHPAFRPHNVTTVAPFSPFGLPSPSGHPTGFNLGSAPASVPINSVNPIGQAPKREPLSNPSQGTANPTSSSIATSRSQAAKIAPTSWQSPVAGITPTVSSDPILRRELSSGAYNPALGPAPYPGINQPPPVLVSSAGATSTVPVLAPNSIFPPRLPGAHDMSKDGQRTPTHNSSSGPAPQTTNPAMPPAVIPAASSASLLTNSMMKDVPKLGGSNSLFFPGLPALTPTVAASHHLRHPFPSPSLHAPVTAPKKTGKWNAMHVRIAWEIYNHQQKQKSDSKSIITTSSSTTVSSATGGKAFTTTTSSSSAAATAASSLSNPKLHSSSTAAPGSIRLPPPPGALPPPVGALPSPADLLRRSGPPSAPSSNPLFHPGLPRPPGPLDPMNPYGFPRSPFPAPLYGPSPMDALSPFPRYGTSPTPFGGLGSMRGATPPGMPNPSDPFGLTRPPFSSPISSAASSPSSSNIWPLKSESSLLSAQEKQRREIEGDRRSDKERMMMKRDRENRRVSQDGVSPVHRNGSLSSTPDLQRRQNREASRSPLRTSSSLSGSPRDVRHTMSPLVKKEQQQQQQQQQHHHQHSHHRPSSALDMRLGPPNDLSLKHDITKDSGSDNEITVISEKDGNTTIAHQSTNGRSSVNERPSSLPKRDLISPHIPPASTRNSINPSLSNPASPFYSRASMITPTMPYGYPSMSAHHDPRLAASLYAGLMAAPPSLLSTPGAPPGLTAANLAAANDPLLRDPYRFLSMYGPSAMGSKDPLREARERELLRMNPLGSMIMSEQDRVRLALSGYQTAVSSASLFPHSSHSAVFGGFPPSPMVSSMAGSHGKPPLGLYPPPPSHGYPPGAGLSMGQPGLPPPLTSAVNGHNNPSALGGSSLLGGKDSLR